MLYKELYFRHLYAKLGSNITIEQRIESWDNYTTLFERIFSDDDDDNLLGEAFIFMARGLGLAECRSPPGVLRRVTVRAARARRPLHPHSKA